MAEPAGTSKAGLSIAAALALAAAIALTFGLAHVTGPKPAGTEKWSGTVADWPLRFEHHNFGAVCFDTQYCQVSYNKFPFGTERATPAKGSLSAAHFDQLMWASYGPVPRTAPPAEVSWTSSDGTSLKATIDIAQLFADGLVRHDVSRGDIAEGVSMGTTHVLLEIADRTISVFTRTMIPLKDPPAPGQRGGPFRSDLIEVYSRVY